jgi:WD40 repeat protein
LSGIFLSHSSADNDAALQLHDWLEKQGYRSTFLDFDPTQGIPAGRDWERELYAQLRACRAVVVLCSRHSMASPWCFAEITHARALGKALFPLKVADCEIQALLQTVQVVDLTTRREEGLERLSHGLKAAGLDPAGSFDWDGSRPPYPGLLAFEEPDAAVFFGRENEIRDGLDALGRQRRFGGARFVLLLGASGSGKSSLLKAGILPRLHRNPAQWIIVPPFRPLGRPLESLAYVLARSFEEAGKQRDWKELHGLISAEGAGDALTQLARELSFSIKRPEATVLLCIDQLEELFTLSGPEEADRFLSTLRGAAESAASQILIAATVRSDFLGAVQTLSTLREVSFAELLVNPMSLAGVGQIIEGPAAIANLELEPGLVQAMLQDTEAEGALPLLAFTLRELWEQRRGDRLTLAEYRDQLGGLSGSVARAAEGALDGAQAVSSQDEIQLRQAFLTLVRVNDEGHFTRRPANWADLPERIHPLIERLVQARLLVSRQEGAVRVLEVAHEALFRAWGRLAAWLDQDRAFLLWRKRLDQALDFWVEGGKSRERLLSGALLRESEGQMREHGDPLSKEERTLISASVAADRLWRRIRNLAVGAVAVVIIAAGAYALSEAHLARQQHDLAVARQLATEARFALDQGGESAAELQRSLLLATSSLKFAWTQDGFEAWSKAIELSPRRPSVILGPKDGPYAHATFSADGKLMAAAGKDSIFVIDAESLTKGMSPKILAQLPQAKATTLAFSPPDGQLLASVVGDKVIIWSVVRRELVKELPADGHQVKSIAFDSAAKRLATAGMYYYARVFETEGWSETGWVGDGNSAANSVAFSPDDRWLLTNGSKLVAWELATAMRPPRGGRWSSQPSPGVVVEESGQGGFFISFSNDGHWLAAGDGLWTVAPTQAGAGFSASDKRAIGRSPVVAIDPIASFAASHAFDGEFGVWRISHDPPGSDELVRILLDIKSPREEGATVAFGPAGKWLVSAGDRLELWDPTAGAELAPLRHDTGVLAVAVSPNGQYVATTTVDGYAHIWRTSDWTEALRVEIRKSDADHAESNIAFSSDNLWLAATSQNLLKIFSTEGWHEVAGKEHEHSITSVTFSPDARWVITVESDFDFNNVNLLAIKSWQATHLVHGTRVNAISISPDGRWVSTRTNPSCQRTRLIPGVARVWQIADGHPQASMPLVTLDATSHFPGCNSQDEQESPSGTVELARDAANWTVIPFKSASPLGWTADPGFPDSIELRAPGTKDRPAIRHRAGAVKDMAFSQDGRWLVTSSADGVARVWALSREDMMVESCERLTRDLSEQDWQHLGIEPHPSVCPGLPPLQN